MKCTLYSIRYRAPTPCGKSVDFLSATELSLGVYVFLSHRLNTVETQIFGRDFLDFQTDRLRSHCVIRITSYEVMPLGSRSQVESAGVRGPLDDQCCQIIGLDLAGNMFLDVLVETLDKLVRRQGMVIPDELFQGLNTVRFIR
ncbi:hypothetical protein CA54_49740 [Symmachiella macrocystis]|uniref:Uncharacterized protein n=1 Tax=Symmachiella macrocystis TaxID=2527985 RepID=A0A5C6B4B2_9PLAN|nr:hypothetical protein CA54_49740 [Symmachiella macrocystis]